MNDEPYTPLDLASIKEDLARSFVPGWAKQAEDAGVQFREVRDHGEGDRREGRGGRRGDRGPRQERGPRQDRGPARGAVGARPGRRQDRRDDQRARRVEPRPEPALVGWTLQFKPDPRGVDGVAKYIKAGAQAYRLFDLAWLVLQKPERYRVEFRRASDASPALFQVRIDGSVWLSEREAVGHVMANHLEKYYRRERVATDPPKGTYPFVAVCGMSGVLLGPPNYHDYQAKVRRLHAERFADVPFDVFRGRIRMDRDEAAIQKWKEEQSAKDEFYPLETPEGEEPARLGTLAEVEQHFRQNHGPKCVVAIRERAMVPGAVALGASSPAARALVRSARDEIWRFPLPLAQILARQLVTRGLHVFKGPENVTYISVARPKFLDRKATPVADGVGAILEYLESHASTPRAEQWKGILASRPVPEGKTEADRDSAVAADLLWLLHEGHVIDYAGRGLRLARRPKPQPVRKGSRAVRDKHAQVAADDEGGGLVGESGAPSAEVSSEADAPEASDASPEVEEPRIGLESAEGIGETDPDEAPPAGSTPGDEGERPAL